MTAMPLPSQRFPIVAEAQIDPGAVFCRLGGRREPHVELKYALHRRIAVGVTHAESDDSESKLTGGRRNRHVAAGAAAAEHEISVWHQADVRRSSVQGQVGCGRLQIVHRKSNRRGGGIFVGDLVGDVGKGRGGIDSDGESARDG